MEILYLKMIKVEGFDKTELVEVFDYLHLRESEARGFILKEMDLRRLWIHKFLSQME